MSERIAMKDKATDSGAELPTEDDIAQASLGGPRGAKELEPAKMTPQREKKTPRHIDPGHTA